MRRSPWQSQYVDPIKLAMQFFFPGWHFTSHNPYKSLTFYKNILLKIESIFIKPIYDRNDDTKFIYHSLFIKKSSLCLNGDPILRNSKSSQNTIVISIIMIIWNHCRRFSFIKIRHSVIHGSYNLIINLKVKSLIGSFDGRINMA